MNIKFVDLPRQNKILKKQLMKQISGVIDHADFNMGPRLERFETSFARFCGKKYAVGVNSGTDALLLPLMAYGIGNGDEVILPANSYFSTAQVISQVGAIPVFVDVEEKTSLIDAQKIAAAITKKTKAIIPVHLYGQACDMQTILRLAMKYKLVVIEDACQAHGALYNKKSVPVGATGAFSFFPGKNLGCFGDGGAVVTDDKNIAEKILHLRNDGAFIKYVHQMFGIKSRLDTLQAEILQVKLPYVKSWNLKRRQHARLYTRLLKEIPGITVPHLEKDRYHVFHLYVIEYKNRDALQQYLKKKGIETIIHYPIPIHLQKPYRAFGFKTGDFPISEQKAKTILSLPMFPELTEKEIYYICSMIKEFIHKN